MSGRTATGRLVGWEQLGTRSWGLGVAANILSLEERLAKLESHAARCPMGIDCPGPADEVNGGGDMTDAMLRERCRGGADCPAPDNAANHDAAPAARASLPTADHAVCRGREIGCGTGDTQEIAAFRRFVGEVMNWISEATGFLHDDVLRTDDARDIITDACSRCWDAFDRIAPTDHGASPEAIASVESVAPQPTTRGDSDRTDKAAPRPSEGTGDTPATHATHGEGSVRREGIQEPAAWGVAGSKGLLYATSVSRMDAVDMQSEHECDTHVVPLYRQPTLTDAEREAVDKMRVHLYEISRDNAFIDEVCDDAKAACEAIAAFLERMGGGR
jgi:hypothetical protein